jgi:hypothetical protein
LAWLGLAWRRLPSPLSSGQRQPATCFPVVRHA